MKKFLYFLVALTILSSCDSIKKGFGLQKDPPDEFLIKKTNPIEVPPNYDLLPPDSKTDSKKKIRNKNVKNIIDENLNNKKNLENNNVINNKKLEDAEEEILKKIKIK